MTDLKWPIYKFELSELNQIDSSNNEKERCFNNCARVSKPIQKRIIIVSNQICASRIPSNAEGAPVPRSRNKDGTVINQNNNSSAAKKGGVGIGSPLSGGS